MFVTVLNTELLKISYEIGDIWKEVGLKLKLERNRLNTIELNNLCHNEKAALDMLFAWKAANDNVSLGVLNEAIKWCRTNISKAYRFRGMYKRLGISLLIKNYNIFKILLHPVCFCLGLSLQVGCTYYLFI